MASDPVPSAAAVTFASASQAGRRVGGVAAVARIVRELAEAGFKESWIVLPPGDGLDQAALDDVRRLQGEMAVRIGPPATAQVLALAGDRLILAEAIGGSFESAIALDRADAAAEII